MTVADIERLRKGILDACLAPSPGGYSEDRWAALTENPFYLPRDQQTPME